MGSLLRIIERSRHRWPGWLAGALTLALPALAWARVGGGEHFDSGRTDGSDAGGILELLFWVAVNAPCVGIPLLIAAAGYFLYQRTRGEGTTRRALDRADAERRTTASSTHVANWVEALKAKDPQFELLGLLDRVRWLFGEIQDAWFRRHLEPVRPFLSDGAFQRLVTQLGILERQGVRDALADVRVLDLQLIGLEQTVAFDTVHVRVTASMRDTDVATGTSDDDARGAARRQPAERFVEVWSLSRRPGVESRVSPPGPAPGCPNCGAPFLGGATNRCDHCQAIVNSGAYDWVLAEITQGSEHAPSHLLADGVARVRQTDPGLSLEALEDRASLVFWKWIAAQVHRDPSRLAKVALPQALAALAQPQGGGEDDGRPMLTECAVGAVNTRSLTVESEHELAAVEVRWSARPRGGLAAQPRRSILLLRRRAGATTPKEHGLATSRCPSCAAPLSDNGQGTCEYCGATLVEGAADWVLAEILDWEAWVARSARGDGPAPVAARIPDRDERERLVFMMAALASADGVVDRRERALLRMTADRWGISWSSVELALGAGPALFERLLPKDSAEAEVFLGELVSMALIDGKIDLNERKMLEAAASHLGLGGRLDALLEHRTGT